MRLLGKKALITGAGRGLGRAIAVAFAVEGADVAVWDLDQEGARETEGLVKGLGRNALALQVDVSDGGQVKQGVASVLESFGSLDILVNNAGICPVRKWEEITEEEWDLVMAVNLKGAFLCSQAVTPMMKDQNGGRIINLGSVAGKVGGIASGAHYAVSKAGVICLTKSTARALAPHGITVNALAPGVIETVMTRELSQGDWDDYLASIPLGRIGAPDDLARAALFLASDDAAYITGEILDVNGGMLMD